MSEHHASIHWRRGDAAFNYETYSRDHDWRFDGGPCVPASAAPAYRGNPGRVDPEEAFVAAVSSCHMLTLLAIAARKRWIVERYDDDAVGTMSPNADGRLAVTRIELRPRIEFAPGSAPDAAQLARLHEQAHADCFIANSVRTEVVVRPPP
ncbi:OsmC family protein [Luteimonas vadosa]|uniref:OsmC family protein n=1 Tax=Luteimonas vadosa TaxID=1165507 RepID=A0ABP9DPG8_9GAMM